MLLVECPVSTTPAERVGLGVPLAVVRIVSLTIHFDFEAPWTKNGSHVEMDCTNGNEVKRRRTQRTKYLIIMESTIE